VVCPLDRDLQRPLQVGCTQQAHTAGAESRSGTSTRSSQAAKLAGEGALRAVQTKQPAGHHARQQGRCLCECPGPGAQPRRRLAHPTAPAPRRRPRPWRRRTPACSPPPPRAAARCRGPAGRRRGCSGLRAQAARQQGHCALCGQQTSPRSKRHKVAARGGRCGCARSMRVQPAPATVTYCTSLWKAPGAASLIQVRMPRVCGSRRPWRDWW
jgi:hypothetical protein